MKEITVNSIYEENCIEFLKKLKLINGEEKTIYKLVSISIKKGQLKCDSKKKNLIIKAFPIFMRKDFKNEKGKKEFEFPFSREDIKEIVNFFERKPKKKEKKVKEEYLFTFIVKIKIKKENDKLIFLHEFCCNIYNKRNCFNFEEDFEKFKNLIIKH